MFSLSLPPPSLSVLPSAPREVCSRVRARVDATLNYAFARPSIRRPLFSYFDEPTYFERVRSSIRFCNLALSHNQMEKWDFASS